MDMAVGSGGRHKALSRLPICTFYDALGYEPLHLYPFHTIDPFLPVSSAALYFLIDCLVDQ